jgi:HD-like signal output (HDOD) protein
VAGDISEDQVIAAAVLRMANSPLYRGLDRINGLSQAVVRLGGNAIRTLMLQQSLRAVAFQSHGGYAYAEMLWTRAMAAGCIARGLGPFAGIDEESAFLMGLLHDIGGVIVVRAAHSQRQIAGYDVPEGDFEYLCHQCHQEFGELIAENWQLPDDLKSIITDHHRYPEPDDPLRSSRLLMMLTDMITSMMGYAPQPVTGGYDLINSRPVLDLGLADNPQFRQYLDELPDRLEESVHSF